MKYRGFSQAELDAEYSPSAMVGGDIEPYLSAYSALSATARAELIVHENLAYGPRETQILDFFPASASNAALHVFIHGGYWQALSQKESAPMANSIVGQGSAFATLNYTIAPEGQLGQMVEECRDALIWLVAQAAELGFDPNRVTLSGHSAGAHLAAMVISLYGQVLANAGMTIQDAVLISGIYDLEPIAQVPVNDPLQLALGDIRRLSPLSHIPTAAERIRITVAERDTAEFIRQSREYAEHLRKHGVPVSFDLQKGLHHFDIILHSGTFRSGQG